MNVASLLPSATEILYALGVEPVGVSHECDYPPEALGKPSVTRTRVSGEGTSAEINEKVTQAVEEEGGVYEIEVEKLDSVEPDIIITQDVCDVCAVGTSMLDEALETIDFSPRLISLHSHSIDGVIGDIRTVGEAVEREERANEVIGDLRGRLDRLYERTEGLRNYRTVVLDWLEPPMVAGHWVPELIEAAGGVYPLASPGDASIPHEWEDIAEAEPEAE